MFTKTRLLGPRVGTLIPPFIAGIGRSAPWVHVPWTLKYTRNCGPRPVRSNAYEHLVAFGSEPRTVKLRIGVGAHRQAQRAIGGSLIDVEARDLRPTFRHREMARRADRVVGAELGGDLVERVREHRRGPDRRARERGIGRRVEERDVRVELVRVVQPEQAIAATRDDDRDAPHHCCST